MLALLKQTFAHIVIFIIGVLFIAMAVVVLATIASPILAATYFVDTAYPALDWKTKSLFGLGLLIYIVIVYAVGQVVLSKFTGPPKNKYEYGGIAGRIYTKLLIWAGQPR